MLRYAIIAVMVMAFAVTSGAAYAASLGEHIEPLGHLKYAVSAEYNHVIDKDFEGDIVNDATTDTFSGAEIDVAHQAYAKLAIGLTDYFNLYTKLGASDLDIDLTEGNDSYALETEFGFLWGVGLSGAMEIVEEARLGVDSQLVYVSNDVDTLRVNSEGATNLSGEIETFELQTSIFLSKDYVTDILTGKDIKLTPYLAGVYNYFKTVTNGNISYNLSAGKMLMSYDLEGDDELGILLGCNAEITDELDLNIESRILSETAISGSLIYRF